MRSIGLHVCFQINHVRYLELELFQSSIYERQWTYSVTVIREQSENAGYQCGMTLVSQPS
jgi:hypothetical protein